MTKTEIFEDVVSIMRHDASCCKDEPGVDPERYRSQIRDEMDDERFLYLMQSYIASFHVKAHLTFTKKGRPFVPYRLMRYGDALYITEAAPLSDLAVGDQIIGIDGQSISVCAAQYADMLHGEPEARQGFSWRPLLSFASELRIRRKDGSVETRPPTLVTAWPNDEKYSCRQLCDNVVYLKLEDFADDAAIAALFASNDALLRGNAYLIIDARCNGGGNDSAYQPLLEFCLPEGAATDILQPGPYDSDIEINYSIRNTDQRIAHFEAALTQELPEHTREMFSTMLAQLRENRGKGFVKYESNTGDEDDSERIKGSALPKQVYLLTDEGCGSSGDAFVDLMRKSPIVTVVGRPTMGILDYSNCTSVDFGEYLLVYPTSRSLYLDQGIQMRCNGVPVDIEIPWTPEHLERDVILDTVLDLIRNA